MPLPELLLVWMGLDEFQEHNPMIHIQDDVLAVREHIRVDVDPLNVHGFEESFVSVVKLQRRPHQLTLRYPGILFQISEYGSRFVVEGDGDPDFFWSFRRGAFFFAHTRFL